MRTQGHTLLEVCIASSTLIILIGAVFGVFGDMIVFVNEQNTRCCLTIDATLAMTKLDTELRRSGRTMLGTTAYPYTSNGNTELHFLRLAATPFSTGVIPNLVWDPTVYTVRLHTGRLGIWVNGAEKLTLCTHVQSAAFKRSGNRIMVDMTLMRLNERGAKVQVPVNYTIVMRN